MKNWLNRIRTNTKAILILLFAYIILQFLWWEVLLVKQNSMIINEKQKIVELTVSDDTQLRNELFILQNKRMKQTLMIVGEGTIFLLLLLYGINQIRVANKREMQLSEQKNNFLLSITHELKTPLATTKLQLQTLKKHQLPLEKQHHIIDLAISENDRLNALIDNVLLATRMQQNDFVISKEKADLSKFIIDVVNLNYRSELDKKEIILEIEKNLFAEIDKIAFPSVVLNLIDNAIKYSVDEIKVNVRLYHSENVIHLDISDQGSGVSVEERKNIFNQFYRSGSEEIRKTKGTGLGLFIVKYLIDKHNGMISVQSNSPKGSIFKVQLTPAA